MQRLLCVSSGDLSFTIDPTLSGRVTQLEYRLKNLLTTSAVHPENWGATYWTSPQSDWGWPPLPEVDGDRYEVLSSESGVTLLGPEAKLGERQFRIEKCFRPGPHEGTIDTCYTIINTGLRPFRMANWEISRLPAGGLSFFPTGEMEITPVAPHGAMELEKEAETSFYDHRKFAIGRCLKLHADGRGGYLAHLGGRLLVIKSFADSRPSAQAPGEGECEIFANEDGKYVELEVQGPYDEIAPGGRSTFQVRTIVCELPSDLTPDDRRGLREFADQKVFENL